ncbi:hypothetical protein FSP39_005460 [Pinctada imbricata]|uniref:Uncharacterized protein n=1 Tax=Pinctada imbricata TaxID=66713 RepID=A0AA88XF61_PINIB|nr:hypothetical protein FSP39_005460 [Pinctada imbricata]
MDVVEDMDKENITTMSKTANVTESSGTPKRLPLKNVSMNKANSRVTSCYSPLTPLMMKTPVNQRKAFKLKGPLPIYRDSDQSEPSQLLQKNLMKKHAKETIKHTKEMYENQLSEKDSIIKELQEKLAAAESVSMETDTVTVPETTSTEISETELVMSSSETMVTERDTDKAVDTDINSSPPLNLNKQLVAEEVEVTAVSVTSSVECEENLDVGDECSTDKGGDDEDDLLPSDSELDKFVAEILDTCVQSIKDDQEEMEQNRTKIHTQDISLQQSDQSVANKEDNSVSEVDSISQTIDHSYCRLCEKDDTGMGKNDNDVRSISDTCVKSEQEKSSTEAEGKSILVRSIVDLVNSDLVCASEVTCPSEDLDSSMRHCSKCEGQTSSVEMQDTSCSPLKFTGCEDELLTPCGVVEPEMNQKHLKDSSCSPCRNPTTDQGCMVEPCLKDADTSMKHLVYSDAMNSPMRILGCDQGTLAVWDTKDADTSTFLIQLNDMANSPVKFPGLDQSTMALWETQDANTSMEQVQMKNAFSSPIKIEMEETGTMASWETQDANTSMEQIQTIDVSSSPMKFLTQEQGIMVETDVVDADTSMLQVEQIDAGSMAVPVSEERYTMTDHGASVSKETAMTPIKISHKSGQHRMTLQDIRSQHPRVVANHIDTLTLELQRLKKENHGLKSGSETVSESEKRKPSTGHSIEHKPEKTKVPTSRLPVVKRPEKPVVQKKSSVEDTKLRQQIQDWKKKCDSLEVELKAAKKSFAEKSKLAGDKHAEKASEKVEEIEKLRTDYETELQSLRATLMSSQESNLKMEELYQSTSADLRNSTNQIQILQTSIEKLQNALQEAEKDRIAQSDRIQDMAENDRAAFLEIQTLNAVIKTKDQHLKEFTDNEGLRDQLKDLKKKVCYLKAELDSKEE